jgi:hypothetical protein
VVLITQKQDPFDVYLPITLVGGGTPWSQDGCSDVSDSGVHRGVHEMRISGFNGTRDPPNNADSPYFGEF